jgi:hypothetical protein
MTHMRSVPHAWGKPQPGQGETPVCDTCGQRQLEGAEGTSCERTQVQRVAIESEYDPQQGED